MTKRNWKSHPLLYRMIDLLIIAVILGILYSNRTPILRSAGHTLDITTSAAPPHADMIYVYAGGEAERDPYAAELYKRGIAPIVMTAGELKTDKLAALGIHLTEGEVNRQVLINHGVPAEKIITSNRGASTWDETNILHDYMNKNGKKTAVLVTSNFHTRRVRMTARKVFGDDAASNLTITAPHKNPITNLDAWWREEDDLITVTNEYFKLIFYIKKYLL